MRKLKALILLLIFLEITNIPTASAQFNQISPLLLLRLLEQRNNSNNNNNNNNNQGNNLRIDPRCRNGCPYNKECKIAPFSLRYECVCNKRIFQNCV
ncbi:unnamed protein product [Clavelina lepadiformis]|uniref:Uncharacterized protein n=1 Tax=Clavelina lepadiformis TaxID=159417 RepID=A0ABP0H2A5_CLALP